jgi:mannitol 2-dehydrogenase
MPSDTEGRSLLLRESNLHRLAKSVLRPSYDRTRTVPAVVHIGVGGFNRSHLAVYLDDLLALGERRRWGEFGVGLLPGDKIIHEALAAQDYLYGLMLVDNAAESYRVIGSLSGHLYAPESREAVLERLAARETAIVSLTVTEGGYFIEDATGRFLADRAEIVYDLEHPDRPRTWVGYVAEAAARRMNGSGAPFTVLSCDNLQANGEKASRALLAYAETRSEALRSWIEKNVSFPNSMVDRITPRTTEEHSSRIEQRYGIRDFCPVVSEPFRQWVLEDAFVAGRPEWELAGAQIVTDVAPYEKIKMRLLNGGHSAIGYLADLLGYSYIHEAVSDPLLSDLLMQFMDEVRSTLQQLPGIDLFEYSASVVKRFSNAAIRDQVARICSDGCTKMAKFIMPSLWDLLQAGRSPRVLTLVIASWLHYLRGVDENGRAMTISDAMLDRLQPFPDHGGGDAFLALYTRPLFGELAFTFPKAVKSIQAALDVLRSSGVRAAVTKTLSKVETS